ncbi:MAG: bifunctional UDP-sugar hydrolase/5'-nucleotidase [Muribaculaceae bacterium]
MKKIFLALSIALICFVTGTCGEHLILLQTNDTHSQIDPDFDGKGGILRRKVLIDSVRNAQKNVVLIDAGDAVQGTLYFSKFGGKVEFQLMDSLKYDIQILGNHEFDIGIDSIATFYKKLNATKLSANYDFKGTKLEGEFLPYIIKEYNGKKVGFIGINLNPDGMISDDKCIGLKYRNAIVIADSIATMLKKDKNVDLTVVISHIGYAADKKEMPYDIEMAQKSKNIDIILGGHSHTVIDPNAKKSVDWNVKNADGKNVLICQTGRAGKNLGYVDIDLDDLTSKYSLIPVDKRLDNRIDKSLEAWLKPYSEPVQILLNTTVATSKKAMSNGRLGALTNFVADAAVELAQEMTTEKVDFSIMNKGGIRQSMPKGNISLGLVEMMFPFDNKLVVMRIKGSDILAGLKIMTVRNGDAISKGLKVCYDDEKDKIVSAKLNGEKINKNKYYTIATLDYLAKGGDYMASFKNGKIIATSEYRFGELMLKYVKSLTKKGKLIDASDESRMYEVD